MGNSAKRKREKKQDFQKPKLKVGKTKAKAANYTDTSFKAKSIVLASQSLSTAAPTVLAQFTHNLSLLSSKTDSQRRDALGYLINTVAEEETLPLPVATIIPKLQPLVMDISNSVRAQLLKLLKALPPADLAAHTPHLLLYIRAGMTHLAQDIRSSSLDILDHMLSIAGAEIVSCAGGWLKTLNCFLSLLGWQSGDKDGSWSNKRATYGKPGSLENKALVKQLSVLTGFLDAGFRDVEVAGGDGGAAEAFPVCTAGTQLYQRSDPFRGLNLFGLPRDRENSMYDDAEARKRAFDEDALRAVARGVHMAKKEGGEVGRAASGLERVLVMGMGDFDRDVD